METDIFFCLFVMAGSLFSSASMLLLPELISKCAVFSGILLTESITRFLPTGSGHHAVEKCTFPRPMQMPLHRLSAEGTERPRVHRKDMGHFWTAQQALSHPSRWSKLGTFTPKVTVLYQNPRRLPLLSPSKATTKLTPVTTDCQKKKKLYINGIAQYILLWLTFVRPYMRFIDVVACSNSLIILLLCTSPAYKHTILFCPFYCQWLFGLFPTFNYYNYDAINIFVQVLVLWYKGMCPWV